MAGPHLSRSNGESVEYVISKKHMDVPEYNLCALTA